MTSSARRRMTGFTLIEVVVVLAILALVYSLLAPTVLVRLSGPRLENAAQEFVSALREARSTAILSGRTVGFITVPGQNRWEFDNRSGVIDSAVTLNVAVPAEGLLAQKRYRIDFFPGGSSTGGRIYLESGTRRRTIFVKWLTGHVQEQ